MNSSGIFASVSTCQQRSRNLVALTKPISFKNKTSPTFKSQMLVTARFPRTRGLAVTFYLRQSQQVNGSLSVYRPVTFCE